MADWTQNNLFYWQRQKPEQEARQVRPVQHKLPQLTASDGWAGPHWSNPRAETEKAALCWTPLSSPNAHQSVSKEAASEGGIFPDMSDKGITLSGYLKEENQFPKVCSKNSSGSVVPCRVRLFLHSRCDAQGVSWHKMDETDIKWADKAATSFNLANQRWYQHTTGAVVWGLERNSLFFPIVWHE